MQIECDKCLGNIWQYECCLKWDKCNKMWIAWEASKRSTNNTRRIRWAAQKNFFGGVRCCDGNLVVRHLGFFIFDRLFINNTHTYVHTHVHTHTYTCSHTHTRARTRIRLHTLLDGIRASGKLAFDGQMFSWPQVIKPIWHQVCLMKAAKPWFPIELPSATIPTAGYENVQNNNLKGLLGFGYTKCEDEIIMLLSCNHWFLISRHLEVKKMWEKGLCLGYKIGLSWNSFTMENNTYVQKHHREKNARRKSKIEIKKTQLVIQKMSKLRALGLNFSQK